MAYCSDCGAHETDTGGNLVHRATCTRYTVTPIVIKDAPAPKHISRDDVEKAATFLHDRAYEYESGDPIEAKRLNPIKRELTAAAAMLRSLMDRVEKAEHQNEVDASQIEGLTTRIRDNEAEMTRACAQLAAANERAEKAEVALTDTTYAGPNASRFRRGD